MAAKEKKKEITTTVQIKQNLTIDTVAHLYSDFIESLNKKENIHIKSEKIENIDLTGIQFLNYSREFAAKKECKITFDLIFSDSAQTLIQKTGFSSILD